MSFLIDSYEIQFVIQQKKNFLGYVQDLSKQTHSLVI
jgi:hypothetical protein